MKLTNKESLMLQSLTMNQFLSELNNQMFMESSYFERMKFANHQTKDILNQTGLANPATMMMMLYGLLVVPYEMMAEDLKELNSLVRELADKAPARGNAVECIKEAVANADCEFVAEDGKNYALFGTDVKMEASKVGVLLNQLQIKVMMYFNKKALAERRVS